jgi:hypothetical protein
MHKRTLALQRWPWITMAIALLVALNPVGLDFIRVGLFSGEQLSRSLLGPIVLIVAGALLALGLAEWTLRRLLMARRAAEREEPLD